MEERAPWGSKLRELAPVGMEEEWPYNGLTIKQELWCLYYMLTQNGAEATRLAYNIRFGDGALYTKQGAIIKRKPRIMRRLHTLKERIMREGILTLQEHLDALAKLRDEAANGGQFMAAVAAETQRGKAAGHYIERSEVKNVTDKAQDPALLEGEKLDERIRLLEATQIDGSDEFRVVEAAQGEKASD